MIDYSDIVEVDTDSAKARIRTWLARLPIPVTLWAEGGMGEAIVEIGAGIWNEVSKIAAALKTFSVGEASSGTALDIYSLNVYGHTRHPGTEAIHRVVLTCASDSVPHTLNQGGAIVSDGTNSFWLDSVVGGTFPFTLQPGTSQAFGFKCGTIGAQANASDIGAINQMVTTIIGITCTNPENVAGSLTSLITAGANRESDAHLKIRNSLKWATRNPLSLVEDAYDYYARAAAPNITRVKVEGTAAYGIGTVHVTLAADNAGAGSEDVALVQEDLDGRVMPWVTVIVVGATKVYVDPVGTVYYSSAFALASVQHYVESAIEDRLALTDIGGQNLSGLGTNVVPVSDIIDAIENTTIAGQKCIVAVNLTSPVGAVTLTATQIAVKGSLSGITWIAVA